MSKLFAEEANTIDLVTDAMYSISFLDSLNKVLFNPKTNNISLIDFYNSWMEVSEAIEPKMPFSLGIFTGYLYCGLLITKENWSELLPDSRINEISSDWGLDGITPLVEGNQDLKLSYFIRRLRNSLGHSNFKIHVPRPEELTSLDQIHDLVEWTFYDVNPSDASDTFSVTLSMKRLEMLIKKFHSLAHQDIRNRTNV